MDISEETFIINLGVHVRQLREKKNLSQQDLANDFPIVGGNGIMGFSNKDNSSHAIAIGRVGIRVPSGLPERPEGGTLVPRNDVEDPIRLGAQVLFSRPSCFRR